MIGSITGLIRCRPTGLTLHYSRVQHLNTDVDVKNIGWANQNNGQGQKVINAWAIINYLGGTCPGCPLSLRLCIFTTSIIIIIIIIIVIITTTAPTVIIYLINVKIINDKLANILLEIF